MPKRKYGLLELEMVNPKNRHPEMRRLLKFLTKEIGSPCPTYGYNCIVCEAWMAFTRLDNLFETSWWGNRGKKKMSPEESEYQKKLWDKYKAENEKPFKPKKK